MIITKSILLSLACLLHQADAGHLSSVANNAKGQGEQTSSARAKNIDRALKKGAKQSKDREVSVPKEVKEVGLGAKGAKRFCNLKNQVNCDRDLGCVWIEDSCFPNPPAACEIFLSQEACEANGFVETCAWEDDKCIVADVTADRNLAEVTFRRGDLSKDIKRFGFKVSRGIFVRMIARADKYVRFGNGKISDIKYHAMPDGAAVIPLDDGYVYVNNAEINEGRGGVYGLYFDNDGNIVDYKELLSGRSRSCSGGKTPWNTYVSCEEIKDGQCWQVHPDPLSKYHTRPEPTMLGSGYFEAIACDNRDPTRPIFYVLEDVKLGALRKYTPPPSNNGAVAGWDALHTKGGMTEFLLFIDDKTFTWTACDEKAARLSQEAHFPCPEGVDIKDGIMYFVSKKTYKLYILDLDKGTYTTMWTNSTLSGDGEFGNSPDQIVRNNGGDFLYFTEDGGSTPGVYALDPNGSMHAIIEAYDKVYKGDETTGLAFSPDGRSMYASFQDCGCAVTYADDCGCLFQFIRGDGLSFDDESQ